MSLNLATKELSRKELKSIMAGSGIYCPAYKCHFTMGGHVFYGTCQTGQDVYSNGCYCITGMATAVRCY